MATKVLLTCDWCNKEVKTFNTSFEGYLYQNKFKYELCDKECFYAKLQQLVNEYKK